MPVNLTDSADVQTTRLEYLKKDPMMAGLLTKTPMEVYTWVETNVTSLATAKDVLKRLAAATAFLLQAEIDRRR